MLDVSNLDLHNRAELQTWEESRATEEILECFSSMVNQKNLGFKGDGHNKIHMKYNRTPSIGPLIITCIYSYEAEE